MASVTLPLPAPSTLESDRCGWGEPNTSYGDISALAESPGATVLLRGFFVSNLPTNMRGVLFQTAPDTTVDPTISGPELSPEWEGSAIAVTVRAPTLDDLVLFGPASSGLDVTQSLEPYFWRFSLAQNAALYPGGIQGWITDFNALTPAQQAGVTLILDDGVAPVERTGDADPLEGVGSLGEATGTATAPVDPLVLADSDDAGLEVDCKALLVASDDATAGNFFYSDADRGGTDVPLDGELGLGDDDTLISGIRRRTATILQLNDDDNPVALDIGAYFSTGGAGADLTIYLQTLAGEVSFLAAATFSRDGQVRFTLPADAQTLLDGLADGDRWIFKTARAEVITQAGDAEAIEAAGSLGEATGAAVPAVAQTGEAEAIEAEGSLGEATGFAAGAGERTASGTPIEATGSLGEATGTTTAAPPSDETVEANGIAEFDTVPAGHSRVLRVRVCIQGAFGDGREGLQIQSRPSGGAWTEAGFIHGWEYRNDWTVGDTITDENGVSHTCAADGGWIDVDVAIPDTADGVRLAPAYILSGNQRQHDIAIRSFTWNP